MNLTWFYIVIILFSHTVLMVSMTSVSRQNLFFTPFLSISEAKPRYFLTFITRKEIILLLGNWFSFDKNKLWILQPKIIVAFVVFFLSFFTLFFTDQHSSSTCLFIFLPQQRLC